MAAACEYYRLGCVGRRLGLHGLSRLELRFDQIFIIAFTMVFIGRRLTGGVSITLMSARSRHGEVKGA